MAIAACLEPQTERRDRHFHHSLPIQFLSHHFPGSFIIFANQISKVIVAGKVKITAKLLIAIGDCQEPIPSRPSVVKVGLMKRIVQKQCERLMIHTGNETNEFNVWMMGTGHGQQDIKTIKRQKIC